MTLISFLKKSFGGKTEQPSVHKPQWAIDYEAHKGDRGSKWLCMAPFKSMYFGHKGRVVVCCYNRNYVIGRYPERSIRDIWFGPEADELRGHIKNYNLEYGCQGCRSMLEARNYEAVKIAQYEAPKENKNRYPSVMEFELSNECNLGCVMCSGEFSSYIRKHVEKKPPVPSAYGPEFIEQLQEFIPYLEETKFYGGEPFLIPIYQEIWEKIVELSPKTRISVQTNATILSDRVKKLLEQGEFHISISIDSLQKERYESIRRNAVFEKVMENLHYLRDYTRRKDTFFGLSFCLMRSNWQEAADFIRFCNELNCKAYFHAVFIPEELSLNAWGIEQLEHIEETFAHTKFTATTDIQHENVRHFEHWIRQLRLWKDTFGHSTTRVTGAQYMAAMRKRMAERNNKNETTKLLKKLAWMEEIGFGERQMDVSLQQVSDQQWMDTMIHLLVSKSEDELLKMLDRDDG